MIFNRTRTTMIAVARPWHPRDARFLGLIALALVLIALHLGEGLDLAAREGSGHRVIDRQALERRIEAGDLTRPRGPMVPSGAPGGDLGRGAGTMTAVTCELCPRACVIPEGAAGDCRVRVNLGGKLRATTYGRPSAIHIDPMEKKPLYHFHPGAQVFSLATAGCNLHCLNCQNWQLSQRGGDEMEQIYRAEPAEVVAAAQEERCRAIAYTYYGPHRLLRVCRGHRRPWPGRRG